MAEAIRVDVSNRRREQSQDLQHQRPAADRIAERLADFRADSRAKRRCHTEHNFSFAEKDHVSRRPPDRDPDLSEKVHAVLSDNDDFANGSAIARRSLNRSSAKCASRAVFETRFKAPVLKTYYGRPIPFPLVP